MRSPLAWLRSRIRARRHLRVIGSVGRVEQLDDGSLVVEGTITDPTVLEHLRAGDVAGASISAPPGGVQPQVSEWADQIALELGRARLAEHGDTDDGIPGMLHAATADQQTAYEVLVALSRRVAVLLRPAGHPGGPIGLVENGVDDPVYLRAAQLIGFAAQDDVAMVDAIARSTVGTVWPYSDPRAEAAMLEARTTLWAILEVLAREPIRNRPPGEPE